MFGGNKLAIKKLTNIDNNVDFTALSTDTKPVGVEPGSILYEVDTKLHWIYSNNTNGWYEYTNSTVKLTGSKTEDVTFHDAATAAADGTAFTVEGYKTLTVEITRTAGTSTVAFMAEGPSGADIPLMGVNLSTLATAISTTGTGELWQFDITGLTKVFMDLTAVATGPVTVKGKAVAQ